MLIERLVFFIIEEDQPFIKISFEFAILKIS